MTRERALALALLLMISSANNVIAWWQSSRISEQQERFENVIDGLKKAYKTKLQPLEEKFLFERFNTFITIDDSDFDAKPMVLLLGPYSSGKTSFIRYLLQDDFPGIEIGPEPTTDSFTAVMYGDQKQLTPGSVLAQDKTKPFRGLRQFGNMFLRHFKASTLPNPVLRGITLVDTPGILSGKKQLEERGYDFASVSSWFAERADMIILFFDVNKLDIFDEIQSLIKMLQKHHEKMLVVLNKADTIPTPEKLIRVYGGLMWDLGKLIHSPEVIRVYIGSFGNNNSIHNDRCNLYDEHRRQLFTKIRSLSKWDVMNKVDRMTQRAQQARTHAYILCHLRSEMPSWLSVRQQNKQKELIENLDKELEKIQAKSEYKHEFPNVKQMQEQLCKYNLMDFPTCDEAQKLFSALNSMFSEDLSEIARLMSDKGNNEGNEIKGGAFREDYSKHSEL